MKYIMLLIYNWIKEQPFLENAQFIDGRNIAIGYNGKLYLIHIQPLKTGDD